MTSGRAHCLGSLRSRLFVSLLCALGWGGCGWEPQQERSNEPTSADAAQDEGALPRSYVAPYFGADPLGVDGPVIDGVLDDPHWALAKWSADHVDIEGVDGPAPRHRTRTKIGWDDEALYVAAEMEEPHLWAEMTEHDSVIWHEDDFEIFVDPDGDREQYLEVEINALGTIFDLRLERTYIDGGPAVHDWSWAGMRSAVALRGTLNDPRDVDEGWSVEFALPWTAIIDSAGDMALPPEPGDVWRLNFSRVDWPLEVRDGRYVKVDGAAESNWVWSPQGAINMHLPEHWGFVRFDRADESGSPVDD